MADLAAADMVDLVEVSVAAVSRVPVDLPVRVSHVPAALVLPDVLQHSTVGASPLGGRRLFGTVFSFGTSPFSVPALRMTTGAGDVFGLAGAGAGSRSATEVFSTPRRLDDLCELGACL
jgi:hypothetical protein